MKRILASLAVLALVGASAFAQRMPTVTYTATGLAGSWDFEFTLTNNFLPDEGSFYLMGVYLDTGRSIVSTPSGWDSDRFRQWSNQSYGGSSLLYNNVWLNLYSRPDDILPGTSKRGFIAHTTSIQRLRSRTLPSRRLVRTTDRAIIRTIGIRGLRVRRLSAPFIWCRNQRGWRFWGLAWLG